MVSRTWTVALGLCLCLVLLFGAGLAEVDSNAVTQTVVNESGTDNTGEKSSQTGGFEHLDSTVPLQNPSDVAVTGSFEPEDDGTVDLFVALDDDDGLATLESVANETAGMTVENTFWLVDAATVSVDTERMSPETLATVAGVDAVVGAVPVEKHGEIVEATAPTSTSTAPFHSFTAPTNTDITPTHTTQPSDGPATTYGLAQIRATEAWDTYGTRGEGASVAVIDTGIDPDHPDLDIMPDRWADFHSNGTQRETDPKEYDPNGHGTHVSGTVAGGNASGEYIGVAPDVDLYHAAVRVDGVEEDLIDPGKLAGALEWAIEEDVDIVSMSLGIQFPLYVDMVSESYEAGVTVLASSGNDGEGTSSTPANLYESIAVGASTEAETIAGFSSGEVVKKDDWTSPPDYLPDEYVVPTISAPGESVRSAMPEQSPFEYATKSGTSMASPHVAGALALAESATERDISPDNAETALEATAWKPDDWDGEPAGERDTRYGSGIIDAPDLIAMLKGIPEAELNAPEAARAGENLALDGTNSTDDNTTYRWDLTGNGEFDTETDSATLTHAFNQSGLQNVTLEVVTADGLTDHATVSIDVTLPPVTEDFDTPTDPYEPGLYEDVTGDGNVTVADVQVLFDNLHRDNLQQHAWAYDFSRTNPERVTIFDVQALFNRASSHS